MTGAAGAGGYYAWQYRQQAADATDSAGSCATDRARLDGESSAAKKALADAKTQLDASLKKATELEKKEGDASKDLSATKDELTQLRAQKAEADKRMAKIEDIRKQFAKMIDTGQLRVSARHGQLVVSLPAEVLFPSGSADLSKQGEYAVVEVAAVLKKFADRRYLVVGHTDNQDFAKPKAGSAAADACVPKDNWQLSTERALTVTRVMVTAGMDPKNLMPAGEGDHDPVASNANGEGRQKNRRIEIVLLPAINELPPLPASLTGAGSGSGSK